MCRRARFTRRCVWLWNVRSFSRSIFSILPNACKCAPLPSGSGVLPLCTDSINVDMLWNGDSIFSTAAAAASVDVVAAAAVVVVVVAVVSAVVLLNIGSRV